MAEKDNYSQTTLFSRKRMRAVRLSAIAFILLFTMLFGLVATACTAIDPEETNEPPEIGPTTEVPDEEPDVFNYKYAATTAVGYYGEVLDTCERVKPVAEPQNEGAAFGSELANTAFGNGARYPKYGSTLKNVIGSGEAQQAARGALVGESAYLCAWGTRGANRGGEQTPDKYQKIDAEGYLYQYKNNEWIHSLTWGKEEYAEENYRQLYKHTAAAHGMYLESYSRNGVTYAIDDNAKAVVKEVTMRSRGYSSYGITGLYAPAGEVIKVEISGKDMTATGGLSFHIGQALYNGQANNIWVGKNQMCRMPHIVTTLVLNKNSCEYNEETDTWTGYIGSFLGGPIYIRNAGTTFTAKISGGLEYLHFILGYTTEEEFTRLKQESKVPYFDLEVWNYGVLHSGPRYYAEVFSYENLYNAAILWEKVSAVTTTNGSQQGIVFLYDPFVAAGAAVAFPGRSSVNCPLGWMSQSLNYNSLVTSGSWGNFHEYHHNFQNFGLGSGADGETTNNALSLVSYALFTKISAKRGINSYGAQGLGGGWNNYTSATWTLQRVKAGQLQSTNGLAVYATLLHNFGAEAFISARGKSGANNYFNKWATVTHHDFTYYAQMTNAYYNGGSNAYTPSAESKNYPMFVPVSCVYQTGRSYLYDGEKKYFKTMQPYVIANAPFNIDLSKYTAPEGQYASGSIVLPEGFTYKVKNVSKPANGTIEMIDNYNLKYTPAADAKTGSTSGQIVVTLEIEKEDGAFEVEETDLVLEFQISQEVNKMTLERTTYTYTDATMYSDAVAAYEAGFAGSTSSEKQDQFNPTQNANTDIWFRPNTEKYHNDYPNDPDKYFIHENQIEVVDGKLYFDEDGTYRVYLRGRSNCALYYSPDGKTYRLGAKINESTPAAPGNKSYLFRPNAPETYFDVKFDEGKVYVKSGSDENFPSEPIYTIAPNSNKEIENWLYIKEVLIDTAKGAVSFIGVGMRQWTETMFTLTDTYHNASGAVVESTEAEGYAYTKTTYRDYEGKEVAYSRRDSGSNVTQYYKKSGNSWVESTEKEVSALTESKLIEPVVTEKTQPYVNAYRNNYDFPNNSGFVSEYFYTRKYNLNYTSAPVETSTWDEGVKIISSNKQPWDNTTAIDNLLVSGQETFFHSGKNDNAAKGAMILELDMGKTISANKITFYGRKPHAATTAQQGLPKAFGLEVSNDGVNYTSAGEYTNPTGAAYSATVNLNDTYEFRYVRITISSTHSNSGHFVLSGIRFTYTFSLTGNGKNHVTPDSNEIKYIGKWSVEQGLSTFGHVYHGTEGSKMSFEFTGTRLAIVTSALKGSSFEVWIDGNKVDSIEVDKPTGSYGVTYISQLLSEGKHTVEIRCTGDTYFDSLATY